MNHIYAIDVFDLFLNERMAATEAVFDPEKRPFFTIYRSPEKYKTMGDTIELFIIVATAHKPPTDRSNWRELNMRATRLGGNSLTFEIEETGESGTTAAKSGRLSVVDGKIAPSDEASYRALALRVDTWIINAGNELTA